mmetsp:Transcript_95259/g.296195  ORF Transcript_95259/g.296195 Transcript_95259/m.296195 type:complete len:237 (+) Transcript_95259:79-789(+)
MPLVYGEKGFDFQLPQAQEPVAYLEARGFAPKDAGAWRLPPPEAGPRFDARILRHLEVSGHTWYIISCSLQPKAGDQPADDGGSNATAPVEWRVKRRLRHLREGLHDPVKALLGGNYSTLFQGMRFAFSGGLPGTSDRVNTWLASLNACVNDGRAPPAVVALALQWLEAPEPGSEPPAAGETDYSDMVQLAQAVRASSKEVMTAGGDGDSVGTAVLSVQTAASRGMGWWWWWPLPA